MNVSLATPKQRIIAAIAASLIVHAAFLWFPNIELPSVDPYLPPLVAKLEPISRQAPSTIKKRPQRKKPPAPVAPPQVTNNIESKEVLPESSVVAASAVAETDIFSDVATNPLDISSAVVAASSVAESMPAPPLRPPLANARLKFEVKLGKDGMVIGETIHTLEFDDRQYKLTSVTRTTGLARLVKSYTLNQTSWGLSDRQILSPRKFTEEKIDENGTQTKSASFDSEKNILRFENGTEVPLPPNTQDMLSILYQFPPLPAEGDVLPISVTNGRNIDQHIFEITTNEILITRMGKLHTVHFRKQRSPGKEGLEIWFAQEYRLFPVKVRHIEPNGNIGGEAIITEIRVSDK